MTGAQLFLDLLKQKAEELPSAVRRTIEQAAVEAQRAAGMHRGPAERQRVQGFIREVAAVVTVDRIMRRDHSRTHPTRADLAPLQAIAGALDTIDAALLALRKAPTGDHWDWEVALDVGVRKRCYQRKLGAERFARHREEIDQAIDDALTGGAVDAYLPEGAGVYSLRWFLDALRASVADQSDIRERLPGGRPLNERNQTASRAGNVVFWRPVRPKTAHLVLDAVQYLANDLARAFDAHLDCPLLVGQSADRPFLRVLRAIFDFLDITGKDGLPLSDKALADYARRAAAHCPFTAD